MFNLLNYLLAAADPTLYGTIAVIKVILVALMGLGAIVIIVLVLCQKGNSGGGSAITGVQETYYANNKGSTLEGRLKKWTIAIAIAMAVITVVYFILSKIVAA